VFARRCFQTLKYGCGTEASLQLSNTRRRKKRSRGWLIDDTGTADGGRIVARRQKNGLADSGGSNRRGRHSCGPNERLRSRLPPKKQFIVSSSKYQAEGQKSSGEISSEHFSVCRTENRVACKLFFSIAPEPGTSSVKSLSRHKLIVGFIRLKYHEDASNICY
jgi:hypothetical protein